MTSPSKHFLKSNLSEKQIEADVATYLGWCTPVDAEIPFRLLDVDEQVTGADKKFDIASLLYIQFKKSNGLKPISSATASKFRGRSRLDQIRMFRAKSGLESDPILFFQLRAKAKTASDFQHNVLLTYERPPWSRAIYVAPLLLDKTAYALALFDSTYRYSVYPFYHRLRYVIHTHRWASHFGSVPFLREHISIPPHERVSTHNHFYAYSASGVDISWHSPAILSNSPKRLSDFLISLFSEAVANSEAMIPVNRAAASTIEIAQGLGFTGESWNPDITVLDQLQAHGRWLKNTFDIRQFVLLGRADLIMRARARTG